MKRFLPIILLLAVPGLSQEQVDREAIHRIKKEAFEKSQIDDHLFQMVEVHGPRLTNSPGFRAAAGWLVTTLKGWELENVHQEKWGPFGQGWSYSRFSAHLVQPGYETLIGVPMGWTPSTEGVVSGEPVTAPLKRENNLVRDEAAVDDYIRKYKGKLKGEIVLVAPLQKIRVQAEPALKRFSDAELTERGKAEQPIPPIDVEYLDPELEIPEEPEDRRNFLAQAPAWFREWSSNERRRIQGKLNTFLADEGVRLVIHPAGKGDGGTVFPPRSGDRRVEHPVPPPSIAITPEQYNRIFRLAGKGIAARVEVEVTTAFHRDTLDSVNVIAELPGGSKKDELVMIGAHLDSVDAGLGATDNAAGCAVMIEAMRILKTLDLKLDRTVRMALWGGEEQGLLGSKAYIKERFGDPETMKLTPAHDKLAAYFNVDNGTGKIRGVYLQGNDMVRPIFDAWLAPFKDLDATTLSIRDTGGTDHLSFDAVGLPGFQFIQDPVEYETRTHHSNMDVYDRLQLPDLMQAAAIVASFVYHAANRAEKLPREPLPDPQPLTKPEPKPAQAAGGGQ
ncbi:MAG: M20/M25/M40 family metallo-hydrolase [Bryobacterales bacterium]